MLPLLNQHTALDTEAEKFSLVLQEHGFAGDIELDLASRTTQSTDNSIYQSLPIGILYPATSEDVVLIAQLSQTPDFNSLIFCARGGATGTNAQSLTTGLVVDFSRHMTKVLEINVAERWAKVQAGVVKDALNAQLKSHGLFFAPDTSTSNRATIGGMINTDASGQGSLIYGKTRDHVLAINSVLADGTEWLSEPLTASAYAEICQRTDLVGEIHRTAQHIAVEQQPLINNTYPPLNRALTGYDFAHLRSKNKQTNEDIWDINSLLCGSEGTLCFVTEAKIHLEILPTDHALIVVRYRDFLDALADSQYLLPGQPTAIEVIDNTVIGLAQQDAIWQNVAKFFPDHTASGHVELGAASFIEITADSPTTLANKISNITTLFENTDATLRLGIEVVTAASDIAILNQMRKKAVGLLGNMSGEKRPVPFVEDVAVPPHNLADFIAHFRALLDAENLRYGMFGHADAGVIHVRPALNMRDADSLRRIRVLTDKVFQLTQTYGGVLWGEHGKGVRSEYSPATFGELYPYLQQIKACFDPRNQLNPGKVATPNSHTTLLRIDELTTRGQRDQLIAKDTWEHFADAMYCNGNGACFDWNPNQTLCPSYKGSGLRRFSPKGRTSLLKEWLTQLSSLHYDATASASEHWYQLPQRLMARLRRKNRQDFSHQVYDSLQTCLACKACSTQCPIHVDVPSFRSQFFAHYFTRYARPLRHYAIASLEFTLPLMARLPRVYNVITQSSFGKKVIAYSLKLTALPALSITSFYDACQVNGIAIASHEYLAALSDQEKQRTVILVQDVFTRYFDSQLLIDVCQLLTQLGFRPLFAPYFPNGKPLHVLGFLKKFTVVAENTTAELNRVANFGVPLVGIEPSMTLCYRSEYAFSKHNSTEHENKKNGAPPVLLIQEWLSQHTAQLEQHRDRFKPLTVQLALHCTEATADKQLHEAWLKTFAALGVNLDIITTGCCGMAGTFGHEIPNQQLSQRIYSLSWQPLVEATQITNGQLTATGYSCRCQAERLSNVTLPHPLQALFHAIDSVQSSH